MFTSCTVSPPHTNEFRSKSAFVSPIWVFFLFFFVLIYFIYLFLAVLGLCCCARASSSCGEQELLFFAVCGLLMVVASLCCGARALGARTSVVVACGLSSCGSQALERRLSSCGAGT